MASANLSQNLKTLAYVGGAEGVTSRAATIEELVVGEVGIFDVYGKAVLEATAIKGMEFIVATRGKNGKIDRSPVIKGDTIKKPTARKYYEGTDQIDAFGYNGQSGSIDEVNNETYLLVFNILEYLNGNHDGQYKKVLEYTSDEDATQAEIAHGLAVSAYANTFTEPDGLFIAEMICSVASGDSLAGAGDFKFSKGSKLVAVATSTSGLTAGDYIRLGSTTTSAVYLIESVAADSIVLARPYAGETVVKTDAEVEAITAVDLEAGDCGVMFFALPTFFINSQTGAIKFNPDKTAWQLISPSDDRTPITHVQGMAIGSGTIDQVASVEGFLSGDKGEIFRKGQPVIFDSQYNTDVNVVGGGYDKISLDCKDVNDGAFAVNQTGRNIFIYCPTVATNDAAGYAKSATADDITDVLEIIVYGSANDALDLA